jgi:hypothetical protein
MKPLLRPALLLLFLAPLIAEYLLGSLSFGQLRLFPVMLPLYGGGALLVRELARRSGRGWPTMLMLGLAYGIIEEAIATQSLFNPHYLGLRLLDYGFVAPLGIAVPWTVYVLAIHTFWSIAVPIGLVEALYPAHRCGPWLGGAGLAAIAVLYALGVATVTAGSRAHEHFMASGAQLVSGFVAAAAVAATAFLAFGPAGTAERGASGASPKPLTAGLVAFVCGSAFHLCTCLEGSLPPAGVVVLFLVLIGITLAVLAAAGRSPGWTGAHADAAAVGGVLVYAWWGFHLTVVIHGRASLPGQCFPAALVLGLLAILIAKRVRHA